MGVIVVMLALVTGALAVIHVGPFHTSSGAASTPPTVVPTPPDVRGTWSALIGYADSLYSETLHITTENRSSGTFSGTITSPVGIETMQGSLVGATMSFTIKFGNDTDRGVATVSHDNGALRVKGNFTSPSGGQGTIVATRAPR